MNRKSGMRDMDLTAGRILPGLLRFALPMILGNLLQQIYNIADSVIVGKYVGPEALAAVGSTYTLMTFLTSILTGLCMGSGALYSISRGAGNHSRLRSEIVQSAYFVLSVTVLLYLVLIPGIDPILKLLRIPAEIGAMTRQYVNIVLIGLFFTSVYNFFAYLLRAMGDSFTPLAIIAGASVMNILLDLVFILKLGTGIAGAARATMISQIVSAVAIAIYTYHRHPGLRPSADILQPDPALLRRIAANNIPTSVQQSVMNFGILMIQGLVNSFGTTIMAAFTAAVKIDTLAYMPAQEFGNAYSIFVSSNLGAGKNDRIRRGTKYAFITSLVFSAAISLIVYICAGTFMKAFVRADRLSIIAEGIRYLRIEGSCYMGIGALFLFYGCYRGVKHPKISLLLTVISLGTRVVLAYAFAPSIGVTAIWWAIPIGWLLADIAGTVILRRIPAFDSQSDNS